MRLKPGDYDAMLAAQGGVCAICGADKPGGAGQRFGVDHDHKSGDIRDLLCGRCNLGMGQLGDDLDLLRNAIACLKDLPARKR